MAGDHRDDGQDQDWDQVTGHINMVTVTLSNITLTYAEQYSNISNIVNSSKIIYALVTDIYCYYTPKVLWRKKVCCLSIFKEIEYTFIFLKKFLELNIIDADMQISLTYHEGFWSFELHWGNNLSLIEIITQL